MAIGDGAIGDGAIGDDGPQAVVKTPAAKTFATITAPSTEASTEGNYWTGQPNG